MAIKLSELIDAIEEINHDTTIYFDKKENHFIFIYYDQISRDEIDDFEALRSHDEARFISLPDVREINDYRIMKQFCYEQPEPFRDQLLSAIRQKGAFRKFRAQTDRLRLTHLWYAYRDETYKNIAIEWAQKNNIEIE
ncbi:hypothetical protein AOC36_06440 [Erysipelothrix larvae]|uniref:Uncharacterized protein n=1 Tax=Erysipelothrix larvae TaxID=1514105 RepID=A0A0X8H070_9FIRM|nr:UPF0158 family protein [Erysipelothrix larvae]AMC93636.1 hypothetical protein AOC36_06440 [Erysipelothrix larvae]